MTDAQVSQVAVEVIRKNLSVDAQISQVAVEVLRQNVVIRYTLAASGGSLTINGQSASSLRSRVTSGDAGAYAIAGKAANLARGRRLASSKGAIAINGGDAAFKQTGKMRADAGAFSINGGAAKFSRAFTLTAETGALVINAYFADLVRRLAFKPETGAFVINGQYAQLYILRPGKMEFGQFVVTRNDAQVLYGRRLTGDAGAFAISGGDAALKFFAPLKAGAGAFKIFGSSATFARPARSLTAGAGKFLINPQAGFPYLRTKGPFYFAWAGPGETTFSPHHHVFDETIFSFSLTHEEGQIPTLELVIKNPGSGLLNPARSQWAWFAWDDGSAVVPLFYGRLVGVPTDMLGATVTIQFVARANNYKAQKNIIADGLKVRPYYDPLFLGETERDDPDSILEAYAQAWHVDRVTLNWTTSDIITGEDGDAEYFESDAFYDSVEINVGQPPLKSVSVRTECTWDQAKFGKVFSGFWVQPCINADNIAAQWPSIGSDLGGGWTVDGGYCVNALPSEVSSVTESASWSNQNKTHAEGDTMSYNWTRTAPVINGRLYWPGMNYKDIVNNPGSDSSGGYTYNLDEEMYLPGCVVASLSLRYDTSRAFAEYVSIDVEADIQPLLFDATADQENEFIELQCSDITQPIVSYRPWLSIAGQSVALGQVVTDSFGAYHICVAAGVAGANIPAFAANPGDTTIDGSVTWASVGTSTPDVKSWGGLAQYSAGDIVSPAVMNWTFYSALVAPGGYNGAGVYVEAGTVVQANNQLSYQRCVTAGTTAGHGSTPTFSATAGVQTVDGTAVWESLGPRQASGVYPANIYFLCVQAGYAGARAPIWSAIPGRTIADGSVIWKSLGADSAAISTPVAIPGWADRSNSYFTTDRGNWSIEYMIARARAKMLTRARAIEISWASTFARGVYLSCRKNAKLHDPRIPGGIASGKVISYSLTGDGGSGEFLSTVKIGVSVGNGGSISPASGAGVYAADGYMADGYQQRSGGISPLPASDIGYTPPLLENNDFSIGGGVKQAQFIGGGLDKVAVFALTLAPIPDKEFSTEFPVSTTKLYVPKGIDLSA